MQYLICEWSYNFNNIFSKVFNHCFFIIKMWIIPTKKEIKKEIKKIANSFKKRDDKILQLQEEIKDLKNEMVCRKEIELMIREYLIKSEPNTELKSEPNQTNYERVVIKKAIKTRPEALKQAIRGLLEKGLRTTDIFKLIVEEKKIISKTQFYHYLSLVKTEIRTPVRTELRTELK